jgi:hypothetical protein
VTTAEHALAIAAFAGAAVAAVRARRHCFTSRRSLDALRAENEQLRRARHERATE